MRLSTCIAVELGVAALLVSGAATGALWGLGRFSGGEALAAAPVLRPTALSARGTAQPEHRTIAADSTSEVAPKADQKESVDGDQDTVPTTFQGRLDDELLSPLSVGNIASVRFNRGGSSISLRVDFDNGARGAFKPRQINRQTIPRKEVAAYRVNRLLGLSTVAPAMGRKFAVDDIFKALDASSRYLAPRLRAEMVTEENFVIGELSWWIPVIRSATIDGYPIDDTPGIVTWKRLLAQGSEIPESNRQLVAQISDMIVFDFLINNPDRWSGGNARVSDDMSVLFFMDNTLSFDPDPKAHRKVRLYLQRVQRFSRSLIGKLRDLDRDRVVRTLDTDLGPFAYILSETEIDAMFHRRDRLLAYVDDLIATHGEAAVLEFP